LEALRKQRPGPQQRDEHSVIDIRERLAQLFEEASTEDEIGMIESFIHEAVVNQGR
jgi:hypothetical protein